MNLNQDISNKKNDKTSKKSNQSIISVPISSTQNLQLYTHIIELSNYIQQDHSQSSIDSQKSIYQLILNIIQELSSIDSFPNIQLNKVTSTNDAYRILSCALYILTEKQNDIQGKLVIENQTLKKEISNLQKKHDKLLQNESDFQNYTKINNQYEINQFKVGNHDLSERYKEMEKEVSNLIIYLKHHFNLSESTNLYNIIDAINIKCTCEISEKDRIEQLMMQNQDLEERLINLQKEKYESDKKIFDQKTVIEKEANSQSLVLENEISSLKLQLKKITQKYESKKAKSQSLTKKLNDQDEKIKQLERELETSKINYDKLLVDLEDKKKNEESDNQALVSKNDLQIKDDEISNLHSALNEISVQLEKMNEDLMLETTMKNHIFNAFQIQNNIMNLIEQRLSETEKKKNEHKNSNILIKSEIIDNLTIEEEESEDNETLVNNIFLFLSKSNLEKSEIDKMHKILQNGKLNNCTKVTSIFDLLITRANKETDQAHQKKESDDQQALKAQNDRFKKYLSNLLYFIEQVTSSGEMQGFFIESDINYDFREKLIAQCSRIESFMKENGVDIEVENFLLENGDFIENFLDISNFSNYVEEQLYDPDPQELLLLLRQFTFINESIRRFADEMKQQVEKFLSEIKQLRYQISECQEQHVEELNKTTDALQNEIQKERSLKNIIDQIYTILNEVKVDKSSKNQKNIKEKSKDSTEVEFEEEEEDYDYDNASKPKNNDFYILKCLQIIQKVDGVSIHSPHKNDQDSNYIKKLEQKINNEIEKRKSLQLKANEEISRLRSKIKYLKKQSISDKQKFLEEIDYAKKQFDDISASLNEANNDSSKSNSNINISKSEIDEKNTLISTLNEQIQQKDEEIIKLKGLFDLEKEKILLDCQTQNEKIFKEKDEKITSLLLTLENSQSNSEVKVKEVKQDLKQTIKKLQNDVSLETERANNIRNHYEKLFKELKEKLFQSRESEKAAIEKVNTVENELKKAKSTISKLRIDVKMLNLKVITADDKLTREKSLFDSQLKMKILGLQTDHQDRISELKEKYEESNHKFLMKICEIFKDFIDYNISFSEESILNTLQKVSDTLYYANQKIVHRKSLLTLLNDIKALLNVRSNSEIINALTNIINESNEYKNNANIHNDQKKSSFLLKKAKIVSNNDSSPRDWEIWAKRLYSLITDNFSVTKTAKQLQYAIEETLLSAIGQRQLWKKIEILRKEKSFLISGLLCDQIKRPRKTISENNHTQQFFIPLIATCISIYRMRKLTGNLKFNIDFSSKKDYL